MRLTVIVPTRDRTAELQRCLAALSGSVEVVVVDDGSRDDKLVASIVSDPCSRN